MKILYIGNDSFFWTQLQARFKLNFPTENCQFQTLWPKNPKLIHQSLSQVVAINPQIVIVDFSLETHLLLSFTRSLFRVFDPVPGVVGVWNLLCKRELLYEGNMSGAKVNHFKGSDIDEIVTHAMLLGKQGNSPLRKFATARAMDELWKINMFHRMKIGFMTKSYIHLEHDVPLEEINPILFIQHFGESFPQTHFKFLRALNKNYYYHFRYNSDIGISGPQFPEPMADEGSNQKIRRLKMEKEENELFHSRLEKFISTKSKGTDLIAKRTRVLVLDDQLELSSLSEKPLDNYSFSIRLYKKWKRGSGMFTRSWPGIVVYCWNNETGSQDLVEMVHEIEQIEKYHPFIVVFKSPLATKEMKEKVQYESMLCEQAPFAIDQFIKLCELYQSKSGREKTHDQDMSFHTREERFYLDKNNPDSQLSLKVEMKVHEVSESWFKFSSPLLLPLFSIFELERPIRLFLTIVERIDESPWYQDGEYQYKAIIHGLDETARAELRRQVNSSIKLEEDKKKQKSDNKA
ncbi:MAG: hypothetical protein COW00_09785 [Bdellovibrio sp. CG12_big_fil_rev_8_21_14_0_65_39_13]|nr:MAG: hypothetical protein COW78_15910 [Bdellovibrio sp. CG22_combo_CG10-13_8_21_14_all_39_27]PIQ59590.1 MAG: hypothetical protein COW00_09785 [Bdellovibrio sp. CG12_big_fil_rev_8_21_14_0_65_39_13]PIR33174.1 MAG: hypothetical protein COV37_17160 [Bdellovibrio sp. CG11_big_fil_rev_8_21_14_0_20_39_38]PJB53764.1 MAG: hypothetical protein CO099_05365 [Bdellovibrio sp. CG_4_9_14_3_um_filter_39_7]